MRMVREIVLSETKPETEAYGRDGENERIEASVESYAPPRFPRLRLPLRAIFATLEIPEPG